MKKLRFKEADVLDDQISEQNAPETTAIQATPEEVTQATENATPEVPPTETVPEPSYNDVTTPEGSADATPSELAGGTDDVTGSGVSIQPETVSVEVQIPTQQLGQAVAMATGDVRTAETAPDLEAEKQAQAEEAEQAETKDNLVAEQPTEQPINNEPVAEEPAPITEPTAEPQPVQESLEHEEEERTINPEEMGASYRNLMKLRKQRESKLHEEIKIVDEEDVEDDSNEMGASYRNLMKLNAEREQAELHENKNRLVDRCETLTDEEREQIKKYFNAHPEDEAKIDWSKAKSLTYSDFKKAMKAELHENTEKDRNAHYVGKTIEIIDMKGEPQYEGRTGVVEFVDDIGQLHGTWGGCAVIPGEDSFKCIDSEPIKEAVDLPKGSEDTEDLVDNETEEIAEEDGLKDEEETPKKGKLNFKALSADVPEDENPDLPKGFGEDDSIDYDDDLVKGFDDFTNAANDEGIDYTIGFDRDSVEDTTDFADRISNVLGDKDADDINAVADTLRATADYIDDFADEAGESDEDAGDEDFEDDEELEGDGEKLDFKSLLDDSDYDSEDTARVDYETDDDDVADFKESMFRRMSEKRQSTNRYSETNKYFRNIPCEGDECDDYDEPRRERKPYKFAKRHAPARGMRESINRKEDLVKRPNRAEKLNENIDFDSIVFPAGSENVANEYRDRYNDDLVSAHERVVESRRRAINDFHRSVRESRDRYSVPRRSYREDYDEDYEDYRESYAPRDDRFREALNSSVRTSRMNETSSRNPNSWENNRAIDKFEESSKFNFKELLRNGYLG